MRFKNSRLMKLKSITLAFKR
jgi:hypothetical protein